MEAWGFSPLLELASRVTDRFQKNPSIKTIFYFAVLSI